ncbi:MAG: TIGR04190 family B12-binding domain/radical SAM domain protein [Candidatus Bipolaricaulia bacterium]
MNDTDLVLIHPPSVYDFRRRASLPGPSPLSDLIPSSPVFEMYPLGLLTLSSYLEERGLRIRIVNLALRMLLDRAFDVPAFLARLRPKLFGIDLHWLPHAHGALELARLLKGLHPEIPIVLGGLSASYYYRELLARPEVDFVIRGDCAEEPLYRLILALAEHGHGPLAEVPNLAWREAGRVKSNRLDYIPDSLDYVDLRPDRLIRQILRYRDRLSLTPYRGWWENPVTTIFTVKGCTHSCATCGGSREAYSKVAGRTRPSFRSPESVLKNLLDLASISRGPIFLIGDIRQAGESYAQELLRLIREHKNRIQNELVLELFSPAGGEFLAEIGASARNWTIEFSPESHDPELRAIHDPTAVYSNEELEETVKRALAAGCHRFDLFFLIGLSRQGYSSVMATVDYAGELFQRFDRRLSCFISPLGPFLDPGSRAFEAPESLGYRLFARTLEEHRQLLLAARYAPTWEGMLNYETAWLSREELVRATYEAAERLNALKLEHRRISAPQARAVAERLARAKELHLKFRGKEALEHGVARHAPGGEPLPLGQLEAEAESLICDKRELAWPAHLLNFKPMGIIRQLLRHDSDHRGS